MSKLREATQQFEKATRGYTTHHEWWNKLLFPMKTAEESPGIDSSRFLEFYMLHKGQTTQADFLKNAPTCYKTEKLEERHLPPIRKALTMATLRGMQRLQNPGFQKRTPSDWDDTFSHIVATVTLLPYAKKLRDHQDKSFENTCKEAWKHASRLHGDLEPITKEIYESTEEIWGIYTKNNNGKNPFSKTDAFDTEIPQATRRNTTRNILGAALSHNRIGPALRQAIEKTWAVEKKEMDIQI